MAIVTNHCTNPSFETGVTGWSTGGANAAAVATSAPYGDQAMRITASASNGWSYAQSASGNRPAATAGQEWTVSYDAWSPDTVNIQTWIQWFDAPDGGGGAISLSASSGTVLTGTPQRLSHTATAPANTQSFLVFIIDATDTITSGELWYVDGVLFSNETTDYFDGDTTDTSSYIYDWTGTAHASSSTRTDVPSNTYGRIRSQFELRPY